MRGFSLTQPWASLVAIGAKQWETRSWPTPYRGQVAIHASKAYPRDCKELEYEPTFLAALKAGMASPHMLPTASIIALATITDCQPTEEFRQATNPAFMGEIVISEQERAFGKYVAGRFAFRIADAMRLPTPIPCKGALGLWAIPDDVVARIYEQLYDMQERAAIQAAEVLGV